MTVPHVSFIEVAMADIRKVVSLVEPAIALAGLVQTVTGTGGPPAAEAIKLLASAAQAFGEVTTAGASSSEIAARINALHATLVADNDAAHAALAARFPA